MLKLVQSQAVHKQEGIKALVEQGTIIIGVGHW